MNEEQFNAEMQREKELGEELSKQYSPNREEYNRFFQIGFQRICFGEKMVSNSMHEKFIENINHPDEEIKAQSKAYLDGLEFGQNQPRPSP